MSKSINSLMSSGPSINSLMSSGPSINSLMSSGPSINSFSNLPPEIVWSILIYVEHKTGAGVCKLFWRLYQKYFIVTEPPRDADLRDIVQHYRVAPHLFEQCLREKLFEYTDAHYREQKYNIEIIEAAVDAHQNHIFDYFWSGPGRPSGFGHPHSPGNNPRQSHRSDSIETSTISFVSRLGAMIKSYEFVISEPDENHASKNKLRESIGDDSYYYLWHAYESGNLYVATQLAPDLCRYNTADDPLIDYAIASCGVTGNIEMLQMLIDRGYTDLESCFYKACIKNHTEIIKYLLDFGHDLPIDNGINYACEYENIDVVKYLIKLIPGQQDFDNNKAINMACKHGHHNIVAFLITFPVIIGAIDSSVVIALAEKKYWDILSIVLCAHPNIIITDHSFYLNLFKCGDNTFIATVLNQISTPVTSQPDVFVAACESGNIQLVLSMLATGATMSYAGLLGLCRAGHVELFRVLAKKYTLDINTQDRSALKYACISGNVELVREILSTPGLHLFRTDNRCLMAACKCGHLDLIKYLINYKHTNPTGDIFWFDIGYKRGTILSRIYNRYDEQDKMVDKKIEIVKYILPFMDSVDTDFVLSVCNWGNAKILQMLLSHKSIDPGYENNKLLRRALCNNELECAKILLADPRVNIRSLDLEPILFSGLNPVAGL